MKKKVKNVVDANPTLFDNEVYVATWASLKQEYKNAIIVIHVGGTYFTYGKDATQIEKYTGIAATGKPVPSCSVPSDKWDYVFSTMIKAGYQVAVCDQYITR